MEREKKEKVKEKLLIQPISGETYINGDKVYWRKVILKWINENQTGEVLYVSFQSLINYMRNTGVSFNQQEKLIQYPIKNFLQYYEKISKTEFKKKVQLIFTK
jgi:hypothetical protein